MYKRNKAHTTTTVHLSFKGNAETEAEKEMDTRRKSSITTALQEFIGKAERRNGAVV
jgi:hypothetical protein